jgi:hypothetical protein
MIVVRGIPVVLKNSRNRWTLWEEHYIVQAMSLELNGEFFEASVEMVSEVYLVEDCRGPT